jgi:hypothetical protein
MNSGSEQLSAVLPYWRLKSVRSNRQNLNYDRVHRTCVRAAFVEFNNVAVRGGGLSTLYVPLCPSATYCYRHCLVNVKLGQD